MPVRIPNHIPARKTPEDGNILMTASHEPFEQVLEERFDGLVVTGAPGEIS
jgi:homoserine trans-succinylase